MSQSPQNPYGSFVLSASAGCGKTYQLSRRFLYLVGAGAKPGDVLAITFTKKAASEMSQRIIAEAAKLLYDEKSSTEFDSQLTRFYKQAQQTSSHPLAPPRTAQQTGQLLLASTQQLRITTIDSTFWEWVRKFPWEASGQSEHGTTSLPSGFDLLTRKESSEYYDKAFNSLIQKLFVEASIELPSNFLSSQGLYGLKNRFDQLQAFSTYLWLQRRQRNDVAPLNPFAVPNALPPDCDAQTVMAALSEPLAAILPLVNAGVCAKVQQALDEGDWDSLWQSKLIKTSEATISGTYLRGKKRQSVAREVLRCEELLAAYVNLTRIQSLNQFGAFLLELFHGYSQVRDELKFHDNKVEFGDLAKGCYRLFHDFEAIGARFLINQTTRHLLLDEFQDTSRLQWSVFSPLARELLAGEGSHSQAQSPPPSVFIVGDTKQSIYGFREADPQVLVEAADELGEFGLQRLPLNESYRTAHSIMNFVNLVFDDLIPEFPKHATARDEAGQPVSPDCGWIQVSPLFESEDKPDETLSPAEKEAAYVADCIKDILSNAATHPVYDKSLQGYRPIAPRDCAILFRNSTRAALFENELREREIACIREQTDGFFSRQEIMDVRALVRWCAHPSDLVALYQCLISPMGGIPDKVCLSVFEDAKETGESLHNRATLILESLDRSAYPLVSDLLNWMENSLHHKPGQWLETLYRKHGFPELYRHAFGPGEGDLAAANLLQFLELIYVHESEGELAWAIIDRALGELAEQGQIGNAPTTSNAVSLMTIHKSKGLEFPLVILVDACGPWEKRDRYWVKGRHADWGEGVYYTGSKDEQPIRHGEFDSVHERIDRQLREESYRLLYVALTRARQYLMVSGHKPKQTRGISSGDPAGFLGDVRRAFCQLNDRSLAADETGLFDFRVPVTWAKPKPKPPPVQPVRPVPRPALGQVYSIRPHAGTERDSEGPLPHHASSGTDQEYARLRGLMIHSGLEAEIKNTRWRPEQLWPTFNPAFGYDGRLEEIVADAREELSTVVQSPLFTRLSAPPNQLFAEVPFCALVSRNQLVRGRIDLVVETPESFLVIDFKTQAESARPEEHRDQIATYCQAWARIRTTSKPVVGCVLFTANCELVELWNEKKASASGRKL